MPPRRTTGLAVLGLAGVAAFVLATLALHFVFRADEPGHMSAFAHTRFWLLWTLAVYGFAFGGVALTVALRGHLTSHPCQRAGLALLWVAGAGAILLATCPGDQTTDSITLVGTIHQEAAPPTFVLSGAGMIVLAPAFKASRPLRGLAAASAALGALATLFAFAYVWGTAHDAGFGPWAQRLAVACIAAWFLLVGVRLLQVPAGAAPPAVLAPADGTPASPPRRLRRRRRPSRPRP
jgi:hypothetical protein